MEKRKQRNGATNGNGIHEMSNQEDEQEVETIKNNFNSQYSRGNFNNRAAKRGGRGNFQNRGGNNSNNKNNSQAANSSQKGQSTQRGTSTQRGRGGAPATKQDQKWCDICKKETHNTDVCYGNNYRAKDQPKQKKKIHQVEDEDEDEEEEDDEDALNNIFFNNKSKN